MTKRNLIVSRKKGQGIVIGPTQDPITVTVCKAGGTVKLHVHAEEAVRVARSETLPGGPQRAAGNSLPNTM